MKLFKIIATAVLFTATSTAHSAPPVKVSTFSLLCNSEEKCEVEGGTITVHDGGRVTLRTLIKTGAAKFLVRLSFGGGTAVNKEIVRTTLTQPSLNFDQVRISELKLRIQSPNDLLKYACQISDTGPRGWTFQESEFLCENVIQYNLPSRKTGFCIVGHEISREHDHEGKFIASISNNIRGHCFSQ